MKKIFASGLLTLVLVLVLSVFAQRATAQCIMCKAQVEASSTDKEGYDTTGLNKGIVYLMTIPYLLIGSVGFFWYRHTQQQKKKATADERI